MRHSSDSTLDVEEFLDQRWGENWRSSLWATLLGLIGVLCRDILDEEHTVRIKEILAFEADRFIGTLPPSGCEFDTKVEENAQDTMVLAWAINLNPEHPNLPEWEEAQKYGP